MITIQARKVDKLENQFPTCDCISYVGVTTIAGGKWNRGGHTDGPSEEAKFSNDFEVVYIASSCSLLVVDRGNQAIREIQLHFDDCAYQYGTGFPLGNSICNHYFHEPIMFTK